MGLEKILSISICDVNTSRFEFLSKNSRIVKIISRAIPDKVKVRTHSSHFAFLKSQSGLQHKIFPQMICFWNSFWIDIFYKIFLTSTQNPHRILRLRKNQMGPADRANALLVPSVTNLKMRKRSTRFFWQFFYNFSLDYVK